MSNETAILISVLSLVFMIVFNLLSVRRNYKTDDKKDATELTTVIVKLETIGSGVTEIKADLRNVKDDIKENRERIIKVEESAKQAHKRLDEIHKRRISSDETD